MNNGYLLFYEKDNKPQFRMSNNYYYLVTLAKELKLNKYKIESIKFS